LIVTSWLKGKKGRYSSSWRTPLQSYGTLLFIWNHARHKWTRSYQPCHRRLRLLQIKLLYKALRVCGIKQRAAANAAYQLGVQIFGTNRSRPPHTGLSPVA